IDGVVKNLAVHTIGGVVAAGSPIVEIVPVDEQLVVEMRISPNDIGQIAPDQPVRVKISTYDYLTYGALDGRIVRIAADATQEPEAAPYFRAVVETDRAHLDLGSKTYPISPGMLAEVEMVLGRRSVAQYLIEPVLKLRDDALTNR
ncbi:MAG: HlyD family efflux transporter periplasmic adaptor subunit, partial [Pseudomonadota bacterium]